jgi:hypothetical protein
VSFSWKVSRSLATLNPKQMVQIVQFAQDPECVQAHLEVVVPLDQLAAGEVKWVDWSRIHSREAKLNAEASKLLCGEANPALQGPLRFLHQRKHLAEDHKLERRQQIAVLQVINRLDTIGITDNLVTDRCERGL